MAVAPRRYDRDTNQWTQRRIHLLHRRRLATPRRTLPSALSTKATPVVVTRQAPRPCLAARRPPPYQRRSRSHRPRPRPHPRHVRLHPHPPPRPRPGEPARNHRAILLS
ncbi:hypothetical protein ACU686_44175 [Yinghuangia aomiensis]